MTQQFRPDTQREIDEAINRLARQGGFTDSSGQTVHQYLQAKFEKVSTKLRAKWVKLRGRIVAGPAKGEFAEELRSYLQDGVADRMAQGMSEAEAVRQTVDQLSASEPDTNLKGLVTALTGDSMSIFHADPGKSDATIGLTYEAIGLFYAFFSLFGMTVGGTIGWFVGQGVIPTLIGVGIGLFGGLSGGLLSHALIALRSARKAREE